MMVDYTPVCVEVFELCIYRVALHASSIEIAHHYWGNRHHTILYTKTWISVKQGHMSHANMQGSSFHKTLG